MCESHHSPRNFADSSTGSNVSPIMIAGGLWILDSGAVKCMILHLWAANLKPFLVVHSCAAFTACCICLSMVPRERPWKQIAMSSTKSALKMSFAIREGNSFIFNPKEWVFTHFTYRLMFYRYVRGVGQTTTRRWPPSITVADGGSCSPWWHVRDYLVTRPRLF